MDNIKSVQGMLFKHISDQTIDSLSSLQLNQISDAMKEYANQFINLAIQNCDREIIFDQSENIISDKDLEEIKKLIK